MWDLLWAVMKGEASRIWRRLFRRPEPPTPYGQFRLRHGASFGIQEPDDPDHLPH